jgi:hypothetical protein
MEKRRKKAGGKLGDLAESLGRLLGNAERKARSVMGQPETPVAKRRPVAKRKSPTRKPAGRKSQRTPSMRKRASKRSDA